MIPIPQILVGFAAFCIAMLLTPLVRRAAGRMGLVDHPDAHRKLHQQGTPLGGGVAVLAAALITLGFFALARINNIPPSWYQLENIIAFVVAPVLLCGLGLMDDWRNLRGWHKLLGQIVVAALVAGAGLQMRAVALFGYEIQLGFWAIPFTILWILGAINALNLLDGSDGVAATVGIVLCMAIAIMASMTGAYGEVFLAIAMAGALLGFLYYNFPPASIYLGDAGSMVIGLMVGVLALKCSLKGPATVALAAPAAICAIPFLDSAMAILRRKLTGRSMYTTDRGHLHHFFLQRFSSTHKTLFWIGILCGSTALGALLSVYFNNEALALVTTLAVIGTLIATRSFGHAESQLLSRRVVAFGRSLFRLSDAHLHEERSHLQGHRGWDQLWEALVELAERFELAAVRLNVTIPSLHEEFHANWRQGKRVDHASAWHVEFPLVVQGRAIGHLHLKGRRGETPVCENISLILELVSDLLHSQEEMLDLFPRVVQPRGEEEAAEELVSLHVSEPSLPTVVDSPVPVNR